MKSYLPIVLLMLCVRGFSQDIAAIQNEIDKTVWKPFHHAFESGNAEALNALYADAVLRVTPAGIDTENNFKTKNLERFAENKNYGVSIALDFWFDDRKTNSNTSYEVGFYRIQPKSMSGKYSPVYGQFHIVLRKIDGVWKITQDCDTSTLNGKPITQEDFSRKTPIQF